MEGGRTHIFFSSTLAKFSASKIVSLAWASTGAFHRCWWLGGTTGALNQFQNTVWCSWFATTCHPLSSSPEWEGREWQVSPRDPGPRYWPVGGYTECAASRPLGLVEVCPPFVLVSYFEEMPSKATGSWKLDSFGAVQAAQERLTTIKHLFWGWITFS